MLKLGAAVAVIATAAAALLAWWAASPQPRITTTAPDAVVTQGRLPIASKAQHSLTMETAFAPQVAPQPRQPLGHIAVGRQLLTARDFRLFALEALKHPEQGGAFLANFALSQCVWDQPISLQRRADQLIQDIIATDSTISHERLSTITGWAAARAAFADGEIMELMPQTVSAAVEGRDPYAALARAMADTQPGTPERAKVEQAILDSGSSALVSWTLTVEMSRVDMSTGRQLPSEVRAGAELGACVEGEFCSLDFGLIYSCWNNATCYITRDEYVQQVLLRGDFDAWDKAQTIAAEYRASIARRDRSIFR